MRFLYKIIGKKEIKKLCYIIILWSFIDIIVTIINIQITNELSIVIDNSINGFTEIVLKKTIIIIMVCFFTYLLNECFQYLLRNKLLSIKLIGNINLFNDLLNYNYMEIIKYTKSDIKKRLVDDYELFYDKYTISIRSIFTSFLALVLYFIYLSIINIKITFLLFLLINISVFVPLVINKINSKQFKQFREADAKVQGTIVETVENLQTIKLLNLYDYIYKKFYFHKKQVFYSAKGLEILQSVKRGLNHFLRYAIRFLSLFVIGYFIVTNELEISQAVIFIFLSQSMTLSINNIYNQSKTLSEAKVSKKRIDEILILTIKEEVNNKLQLHEIDEISLKDVSFKYPNSDGMVIKNIDLIINKGEKYHLIGENGSGKSTILLLMLGLLKPNKGIVKVNGFHLDEIDIDSYRNNIAWISQKQFYNFGPVKNTFLNYNSIDPIFFEITKKFKLDNLFNQDIESLSDGQRQKILLLLELLCDKELIILDEPDSFLDQEGIKILNTIIENSQRTIIVVSHKHKIIYNNFQVIEIKEGKLLYG